MWTERRSGQENQRGYQDHRSSYERDRTRVVHCPAFRRLQRKTQILGTSEGDFHRTRLTHSLEVASIGLSMIRNLKSNPANKEIETLLPDDDLIQAICLLHDIGHPPFGHGGEVALNYKMQDFGGFEGNAQSLRLLLKTENCYGDFGLDLTRRTLLGVLKYPVPWSKVVAPDKAKSGGGASNFGVRVNHWIPPKAYFDCEQSEVDWLLSTFSLTDIELFQSLAMKPQGKNHGKWAFHNFDCSIMDIADDIAYGVHDLEDAIHLGLISRSELDTSMLRDLIHCTSLPKGEYFLDLLFSPALQARKEAVGMLVNYFITATTPKKMHDEFREKLFLYNMVLTPEAYALLSYLKNSVFDLVIDSQEARTFEYGGQTVVLRLFDAISSNPMSLLDKKNRELYHTMNDEHAACRVISDYIANMTDEHAYRLYERLFGFNTRTIFERL